MEGVKIKLVPVGLIIGLSMLGSAWLVSDTFYKTKALDNALSVTGSAKKTVKADLAKWSGAFSKTVTVADMKAGYAQMASDLKVVKKFFKDNSINEADLVISPVFVDQQYNYNNTGEAKPQEYNLRQSVEVQLKDVEKITELAKKAGDLINAGVIFSPQAPEYFYTKLPEARVELLGDAVKDARARASKIAESGGKKIGALKEASVGVTQVTSVNSIDISDYGTYDTSKIDKDVMITVKTSFNLE